MFCFKCGKEIRDDSVFCFSCGSKVEIKDEQETIDYISQKEKTDTSNDTFSPPINQQISLENRNSQGNQKISLNRIFLFIFYLVLILVSFQWNNSPIVTVICISIIIFSEMMRRKLKKDSMVETEVLSHEVTEDTKEQREITNTIEDSRDNIDLSKTSSKKKFERSEIVRIVILVFFYKLISSLNLDGTFNIIFYIIIGVSITISFYIWLKKILIKNIFHDNEKISTTITCIASILLVCILVIITNHLMTSDQRKKDIKEFYSTFTNKTKSFKIRDLEYEKIMSSTPTTKSEIDEKLIKIDDYKKFLDEKHNTLLTLIHFVRDLNNRDKIENGIDNKISQLEQESIEMFDNQKRILDIYKTHLVTTDEKYFNIYKEEIIKQEHMETEFKRNLEEVLKIVIK